MSQVNLNGYLFLRNFIISFVYRFWLDRKKRMRYSWPRDQYIDPDLEIDPDIWKGQVEHCCIFSAFSNQFLHVVCRCHWWKEISILHSCLMRSTLTLKCVVTFSLLIQTHLICSYSKNSFHKVLGMCCWGFFLPCRNIKSQSIMEKRKHDHKVGTL